MKRKYKLTGCARFVIFMIIFIPIVWIGVSYYQGNDPLTSVKDLFKIENTDSNTERSTEPNSTISDSNILKQELKLKDARIKDLEKEILELKYQLQSQN